MGLAAVLVVGCGGSDDSDIDASTPEALVESLGCEEVSELDSMLLPIRGGAATSGISCSIDGEPIHLFARAPIEAPSEAGGGQGGTVENIRRVLQADTVVPECELAVLISDDVFVVGPTADALTNLGIPGEEPIPVSPVVSYLRGCIIE